MLDTGSAFRMDRVGPLGRIDEDTAVARLVARDWAPPEFARTAPYGPGAFLAALEGRPDESGFPADERIATALRVSPRAGTDPLAAAGAAEAVFTAFFAADRAELRRRVKAAEAAADRELPELHAVVEQPDRNLADYRALPRLLDATVMPQLAYPWRAPPRHRTAQERRHIMAESTRRDGPGRRRVPPAPPHPRRDPEAATPPGHRLPGDRRRPRHRGRGGRGVRPPRRTRGGRGHRPAALRYNTTAPPRPPVTARRRNWPSG
ncbi:hypothetical protein [Streptomyces sp. SCUT-3]|uniref:hypothetical protein n=1 Tax=Streptomyces sp. SCUT-3 TaxID=2684469 RepID=UPI002175052C|nr:hypothetical protein [Streptomyces sp. SCUT-3]